MSMQNPFPVAPSLTVTKLTLTGEALLPVQTAFS
jgi:hypothetical protein